MKLFNEIYNLTYSPLFTPHNLIETLKVDTYVSLNMKKGPLGILAEIVCIIDNSPITFYYEFDKNDYILKVYYYEDDKINYIFNREDSLKQYRSEFNRIDNIS